MGSEVSDPLLEEVDVAVEAPRSRSCPGKKNQGKVPKRIHKAAREKLKREHLNELFLELANSLELNQQNNGKASTLCEATRLLKDLLGQIECLKKENATLLSESHYVTVEKNELKEENYALETQIEKLQSEIEVRLAQSKPDLNVPPLELQQPATHFTSVDPSLQQASAVLVVPLRSDLQGYPMPDTSQLTSKPPSNVSKPHARYPTPADSWPSQLLGDQSKAGKEFQLSGSNIRVCSTRQPSPDNL